MVIPIFLLWWTIFRHFFERIEKGLEDIIDVKAQLNCDHTFENLPIFQKTSERSIRLDFAGEFAAYHVADRHPKLLFVSHPNT